MTNPLQTDYGKEFYNSKIEQLLSEYKIHHFSSHSILKASVVERFNRTLKEKMWNYFSYVNNHCWIDVINKLIINYNSSYHISIKITPIEGSKKENTSKVRENLYPEINEISRKNKYKIDDLARINRYKSVLDKGYQQNYTTEIFLVTEVRNTTPTTYRIKDYTDEVIKGIFYEKELKI